MYDVRNTREEVRLYFLQYIIVHEWNYGLFVTHTTTEYLVVNLQYIPHCITLELQFPIYCCNLINMCLIMPLICNYLLLCSQQSGKNTQCALGKMIH